jgi:hypothetical protein
MECETCGRELKTWKDGFQHEHGYEEWEESDPCPMGCDQNEEEDFAGPKEYFLFRANVARTLMANATVDVNVIKTLESLDEWVEMWWDEVGKEQYLEENT